LMSQKFEFTEERIVFEELMEAMRQAQGRLDRLEAGGGTTGIVRGPHLCGLALSAVTGST